MTLDELYAALPPTEVATGRGGAVEWLRQRVVEIAGKKGRPPILVEVGTWCGVTALAMADAAPNALVVCVDTFDARDDQMAGRKPSVFVNGHTQLERFMANVFAMGTSARTLAVAGESTLVARRFPAGFADLVFIDADHSYEAVTMDLAAWAYRVRPGGTLCGHDENQEDVSRAVSEFLARHAWPPYEKSPDCLWWTTRPDPSGGVR